VNTHDAFEKVFYLVLHRLLRVQATEGAGVTYADAWNKWREHEPSQFFPDGNRDRLPELRITMLGSMSFSEALHIASHGKLVARFRGDLFRNLEAFRMKRFRNLEGAMRVQDTMPCYCSAASKTQITCVHSDAYVTVNETLWYKYVITAFRVDVEQLTGTQVMDNARTFSLAMPEGTKDSEGSSGEESTDSVSLTVTSDDLNKDSNYSVSSTVLLHAVIEEIQAYWWPTWLLAASSCSAALAEANRGLKQLSANLMVVRSCLGSSLHQPVVPQLTITVIGRKKLIRAGEVDKTFRSMVQLFRKLQNLQQQREAQEREAQEREPRDPNLPDGLLPLVLEMYEKSLGEVLDKKVVLDCAQKLPTWQDDQDTMDELQTKFSLQKTFSSLAGKTKPMLVLDEKCNLVTGVGLGLCETSADLAYYTALALNATTAKRNTSWTMIELTGNRCFLRKPWPLGAQPQLTEVKLQ